ncbi:hypothetical protein L218DRAFT_958137 [Marasmius fiardii PR-910]|nr:hypothetical protein L218DRAFT_958137 [Marasmius fiardii PR-910]
MLPDSYANSFRQKAFIESPAQRRARLQFLANQKTGEQRVQTWLETQSTYTVPPSKVPTRSSFKGHHRRNRNSILKTIPSPRTSPPAIPYYPAYQLSSIPEDEPYIFYSTPLPQKSPISPSRSLKRHQRHLSDLRSIPEE